MSIFIFMEQKQSISSIQMGIEPNNQTVLFCITRIRITLAILKKSNEHKFFFSLLNKENLSDASKKSFLYVKVGNLQILLFKRNHFFIVQ